MVILDIFRTTVGATAIGLANCAYEEAPVRAVNRPIYGASVAELDRVRVKLANIGADRNPFARGQSSGLAQGRDGWKLHQEASTANMLATEAARSIVDRAQQLFGGMDLKQGPVIERLHREVRISLISLTKII
jgi:acyl-CoA dehydrogenase